MEFKGIIEETFGSITTIRGYAEFADLKKYSAARNYQRELIPEHLQEISNFYLGSENLFCPEIILSLSLQFDYPDHLSAIQADETNQTILTPIDKIRNGYTFRSNINSVEIKKFKSNTISGIEIASIKFNDDEVPFGRIDGNHRLEASNFDRLIHNKIPFCIVLFGSRGFTKSEIQMFYNINSKALPLTPEKMLEVIIGDHDNFTDTELETNFELSYLKTREILSRIDLSTYRKLNEKINSHKYSYFVDLFSFLINEESVDTENVVDSLITELTTIETELRECEEILSNNNLAVLIALSCYSVLDKRKYHHFIKWIKKNDISQAQHLHLSDVIAIFDKIVDNLPKKVFLARWYPPSDASHNHASRALQRLDKIKEIVDDYSLEFTDLALDLRDLGSETGGTIPIRTEMYNSIKDSDIFIADLTGLRANVMVELGYALHHIKDGKVIIIHQKVDSEEQVPFDLSDFRYRQFEDTSELNGDFKNDIAEIIHQAELGEI